MNETRKTFEHATSRAADDEGSCVMKGENWRDGVDGPIARDFRALALDVRDGLDRLLVEATHAKTQRVALIRDGQVRGGMLLAVISLLGLITLELTLILITLVGQT